MLKGTIFAIISALMYSTLPVFGKYGLGLGLEPTQMLQYRFGFGALILGIVLIFVNKKALVASKKLHLKAAGLGILLYIPQSSFFFISLKYISASTTSLILYLYPLFVLVFSSLIFKEPFKRKYFIAVVFIMIGCCLIFFDAFLRAASLKGIFIALCATIFFSFYLMLSQKVLKNENTASVVFYLMLYAAIGFMFIYPPSAILSLNKTQIAFSIALGVIPTLLAISLLYASIRAIGASLASIFSSCEPVFTVVLAALILKEATNILQISGAFFIMMGIILPNITKRS